MFHEQAANGLHYRQGQDERDSTSVIAHFQQTGFVPPASEPLSVNNMISPKTSRRNHEKKGRSQPAPIEYFPLVCSLNTAHNALIAAFSFMMKTKSARPDYILLHNLWLFAELSSPGFLEH